MLIIELKNGDSVMSLPPGKYVAFKTFNDMIGQTDYQVVDMKGNTYGHYGVDYIECKGDWKNSQHIKLLGTFDESQFVINI